MVAMKVACLQFDSKLGKLAENIEKANAILADNEPLDIDLLVLPELAFSGYQFKSVKHITPHLEPTSSGPSSTWARETASRLSCYTVVGYPEECKALDGDQHGTKRYNSCILVAPNGSVLTNYRKTHLFVTDEIWASEGSGFYAGELHIPATLVSSSASASPMGTQKLKMALGCCMDLNPLRFEAPFDAFEFANHVIANDAKLSVMPMAWLSSRDGNEVHNSNDPENRTLNYWARRLYPLTQPKDDDVVNERVFVACNRIGREGDVKYAGSSAVLSLSKDKAVLRGCLGSEEEGLLLIEFEV